MNPRVLVSAACAAAALYFYEAGEALNAWVWTAAALSWGASYLAEEYRRGKS